MTEEYFNADEDEEEVEELQPLDIEDMEDLMEEMDIEVSDVPSEPDVEELMEDIEDFSQDESFFEELDDTEEVIAEIPDSPQPMNNLGVDEEEVEAIKHITLPILGVMWHPEREDPFNNDDLEMIQRLLE